MPQTNRARGELEREILATLAAADAPLSVQGVLDALDGELAYTTVMTILSRLHQKNAVHREQVGRAFVYSLPSGTEGAAASMTAHRMFRLLDDGGDRAGVLSRFVDELAPEDEAVLRDLLRRHGTRGRRG